MVDPISTSSGLTSNGVPSSSSPPGDPRSTQTTVNTSNKKPLVSISTSPSDLSRSDVAAGKTDSPASPLSPDVSHYPPPPSNAAIEQIIANAMALAGSGPPSNSETSSTGGTPFGGPNNAQQLQINSASGYPFHRVGQAPTLPRSDGSFGSTGPGGVQAQGQEGLNAQDVSSIPRPGGVTTRTGSDGYVPGTGYSGQLPPLLGGGRLGGTIGTFQGRSHTPIMFHPAAVGVDGRVNLFVGNLPYRVRWQDVKDLFRRAGTVLRADVALDPQSNRSRGHGSVLMGSQEDGIKAIEMFNGYNWQTRVLEVRPDRLPPEFEPHPYIPPSSYAVPPGPGRGGAGSHGAGGAGMGMQMGMPMGQGMNMGMGGYGQAWPINPSIGQQHVVNMNSPNRSSAQPRLMGNPNNQAGGSFASNEAAVQNRSTISPPLAGDRRTPVPNNRTMSPFGDRERRSSFFAAGEELQRSDSRSTMIGASGTSPLVTQRLPGVTNTNGASALRDQSHQQHGYLGSRDVPNDLLQQQAHDPSSFYDHRKSSSPSTTMGDSQYAFDSRRGSLIGLGGMAASGRERHSGDSLFGNASMGDPASRPGMNRQDTVGGRLLYVANVSRSQQVLIGFEVADYNYAQPDVATVQRILAGAKTSFELLAVMSFEPSKFEELKPLDYQTDKLMNIGRCSIALGPDGRSKGFGNVLFQNEEDAAVAVQVFDGYDFNGRVIKVRQDRNSTNPAGSLQSVSSSSQMAYMPGFSGSESFYGRSERQQAVPLRQAIHLRSDKTQDEADGSILGLGNGFPSSPKRVTGENLKTSTEDPLRRGPLLGNGNGNAGSTGGSRFRNASHPGRIIMPSFNGFAQGNPLSPVQQRGLPPMTPSMPGYNFHAYPSTPPLHPISFLSPGLGPFSPTLNSPTAFGFNPFHAAPGAPLMTPGVPHPMSSMGNGYGPPGGQHISHTPGHGHFHQQNFPSTPGAPIGRGRSQEPDYFPPVPSRSSREPGEMGRSRGPLDDLGEEDDNAGLGLAPISESDMQRLSNVTGTAGSTSPHLGAIREQIESLVLASELPAIAAPTASGNDLSEALATDPTSMIGSGSVSRASFDLGFAGRQTLNAMLDQKGLFVDQNDKERDRRASMDDSKRV